MCKKNRNKHYCIFIKKSVKSHTVCQEIIFRKLKSFIYIYKIYEYNKIGTVYKYGIFKYLHVCGKQSKWCHKKEMSVIRVQILHTSIFITLLVLNLHLP